MDRNEYKELESDRSSLNKLQKSRSTDELYKTLSNHSSTSSLSCTNVELTTCDKKNIVWLDNGIDQTNGKLENSLHQIRDFDFKLDKFTDIESCFEYLKSIPNGKIFLVVSDTFDDNILHILHELDSVGTMLILSMNRLIDCEWTKEHTKVECVCTSMDSIWNLIVNFIEEQTDETIRMNFVSRQDILEATSAEQYRNRLDPSFMYSLLFKEIIMDIEEDPETAMQNFISYCRERDFPEKEVELFERSYKNESPIAWYSKETFLYRLLNSSLRTLNMECMKRMGFFIRALHTELTTLHHQQSNNFQKPIVVYRGQAISSAKFQELIKCNGGLLCFNNFLSTTKDENVASRFIDRATRKTKNSIPLLFIMYIDPSVLSKYSNPFASIERYSTFQSEREILFSTHAVFRINNIQQRANNDRRCEVQMTLTDERDPDLAELADRIRADLQEATGWYRLADLLIRVGQYKPAEELYNELLKNSTDAEDQAHIYHRLGWIKSEQGNFKEAAIFYKMYVELNMNNYGQEHTEICSLLNSFALLCDKLGNHSAAVKWSNKALQILESSPSPANTEIGIICNNIGLIHEQMGEYEKALQFYEKGHEMLKESLIPNAPELATSYNNLASMYQRIGCYQKAKIFCQESLRIRKQSLPSDHHDLGTSYNNIGLLYKCTEQYSNALEHLDKARKIFSKSLHAEHPDMAAIYNNIGSVYSKLNNYVKALEFFESALKIRVKTLPSDHLDLADNYNNIGEVYMNLGEYSKAVYYYEKDQEIMKNNLPIDHPNFAISFDNLGRLYYDMGDYDKALELYKKALDIKQKSIYTNHYDVINSHLNCVTCYERMGHYDTALEVLYTALHIQEMIANKEASHRLQYCTTYSWFGNVYRNKKEYSKALHYLQKCYDTAKDILSADSLNFGILYSNIGDVHALMGNYEQAISYLQQARTIQELTLCNPLDRARTYLYFGKMYLEMHEYSDAIEYLQKAREIFREKLSNDHPELAIIYHIMAKLYFSMENYHLAKEYAQQAVEIADEKLPNHPNRLDYREMLEKVQRHIV